MKLKTIPTNPQYSISMCGTVVVREIGSRNKRPLKLTKHYTRNKSSYYLYCTPLTKSHVNTMGELIDDYPTLTPQPVHRLVALAWIGPPPDGKPWINHKDGNKTNNHYTNLEWTSISENIQHKYDKGLYVTPKGKDHWKHGTKATKATKIKMSAKKIGENHPKFKGWYVINGRKYTSANQASELTGIDPRKVRKMCMNKIDGCYFLDKNRLK